MKKFLIESFLMAFVLGCANTPKMDGSQIIKIVAGGKASVILFTVDGENYIVDENHFVVPGEFDEVEEGTPLLFDMVTGKVRIDKKSPHYKPKPKKKEPVLDDGNRKAPSRIFILPAEEAKKYATAPQRKEEGGRFVFCHKII